MDKFSFKSFMPLFGANFLLNVSMNIGLYFIEDKTLYLNILMICEVATMIIESFIFYYFSKKKYWYSLLASFTANILSLTVGYLLGDKLINKTGIFLLSSGLLVLFISLEIVLSLLLYLSPGFFGKQDQRHNDQTGEEAKE